MSRSSKTGSAQAVICLLAWAWGSGVLLAQDIEPRRWSYMPVGTNIVGLGYAFTRGDLSLDPALRIESADLELHTAILAYNHYFDLFGKTARVDVQLPVQDGHWEGLLNGNKASARRDGLADPRIRLSVNFVGAPALRTSEFLEYREKHSINTTVGAALAVHVPLGEYKDDKLINLGQNRFTIRPQVGVLHTRGSWSYELSGSVFFYTDNDDFFGGNRLEQDPLYEAQAHVVRTFGSTFWVSAGASYGLGGETTIDGTRKNDNKSNLLYGLSFGFPITRSQSFRLGYIRGETFEDTGMDSDTVFMSWALRF